MRYVIFTISLMMAALTMQAQTQQEPKSAGKPLKIVIMGSSTAVGVGAKPIDSSWVNRYRVYLKKLHPQNEVLNLAVSGYVTYKLMPTGYMPPFGRPKPDTSVNITKAIALRPDAIILNLPSNDTGSGYSVAEQKANFDTLARYADKAGIPIWVCSTQPRNYTPALLTIQKEMRDYLMSRFGDKAINCWDGLATEEGFIKPEVNSGDGIHLNNRGHRLLLERMMEEKIPELLRPK